MRSSVTKPLPHFAISENDFCSFEGAACLQYLFRSRNRNNFAARVARASNIANRENFCGSVKGGSELFATHLLVFRLFRIGILLTGTVKFGYFHDISSRRCSPWKIWRGLVKIYTEMTYSRDVQSFFSYGLLFICSLPVYGHLAAPPHCWMVRGTGAREEWQKNPWSPEGIEPGVYSGTRFLFRDVHIFLNEQTFFSYRLLVPQLSWKRLR